MDADIGRGARVVAGRYALVDVLGRGGMGTVWLAEDRVLERQVALKEVTFSIHVTDEERAVLRERTLREARAAARLDHPCVARVYDVVEEGGKPWLVMERVAARSLQEIVEEQGPLAPAAVATIGLDVLAALDAAHQAGIVHRDVKPANVLVQENGHACLTDFGIATTTGDSSLTTQGALIGSPSYMAPERASGGRPGPPADLWSLGATLYTAVEGRAAFHREEAVATLLSVVSEDPAPMDRAGPLEPVLRGLLTKDPAGRSTVPTARRQLQAVAAGRAPEPLATPAPSTPAPCTPAPSSPAPSSPAPSAWAPSASAPSARGPSPRTADLPAAPAGVPGGSAQRIDSADLKALASASAALLGSVAREHLSDRQRDRTPHGRSRKPTAAPAPAAPARRRRFKRRWVVVPVVTTLAVVLLLLGAAGVGLALLLDLF